MTFAVIVNESTDPTRVGDLTAFQTVAEAEAYFEPWFVEEKYFALRSDGRRLHFALSNEGDGIRLHVSHDEQSYSNVWDQYQAALNK